MLTYILFHISDNDIKTMQIPNRYSVMICILAFAMHLIGLASISLNSVNIALTILILSSLFCGLGDAKLLASLALLFGTKIFVIAFASFALAGLYALINLASRNLNFKDSFAFAPFIAVSALSNWICILSIYAQG